VWKKKQKKNQRPTSPAAGAAAHPCRFTDELRPCFRRPDRATFPSRTTTSCSFCPDALDGNRTTPASLQLCRTSLRLNDLDAAGNKTGAWLILEHRNNPSTRMFRVTRWNFASAVCCRSSPRPMMSAGRANRTLGPAVGRSNLTRRVLAKPRRSHDSSPDENTSPTNAARTGQAHRILPRGDVVATSAGVLFAGPPSLSHSAVDRTRPAGRPPPMSGNGRRRDLRHNRVATCLELSARPGPDPNSPGPLQAVRAPARGPVLRNTDGDRPDTAHRLAWSTRSRAGPPRTATFPSTGGGGGTQDTRYTPCFLVLLFLADGRSMGALFYPRHPSPRPWNPTTPPKLSNLSTRLVRTPRCGPPLRVSAASTRGNRRARP